MSLLRSAANFLKSATTSINIYSATAPTTGQVLTATSSTAATWQTPSSGGAAITTETVYPNYATSGELAALAYSSNTRGYTTMFKVSGSILVNKISYYIDGTPVDGTLKIGIYSEDGQTKIIDHTTGTLVAGATAYTDTVSSPATLTPGNYYLVIVPVGTASINPYGWSVASQGPTAIANITNEPKSFGYQTVTASTLPTTFNPVSAITVDSVGLLPFFRLDT